MPTSPRRPDAIDSFATLWLAGAVHVATMMTAPFNAVREPLPHPPAPSIPDPEPVTVMDGYDPATVTASIVSAVRPGDAAAAHAPEPGTTETCRDCRFYAAASSAAGECRRFAPEMVEGGSAQWPFIEAKGWCGMHVPAFVPVH